MTAATIRRRLRHLEARAVGECPDCRPERLLLSVPDEESIPEVRERCTCGRDLRGRVQVIVGLTVEEVVGSAEIVGQS